MIWKDLALSLFRSSATNVGSRHGRSVASVGSVRKIENGGVNEIQKKPWMKV